MSKKVKKILDKKLTRVPLNFEELLNRELDSKIFRQFSTKFNSEIFIDLHLLFQSLKNANEEKTKEIHEKIISTVKSETNAFNKNFFEKITNDQELLKAVEESTNHSLKYLFFRLRSNQEWKEFSEKQYPQTNRKLFEDFYKINSTITQKSENIYECWAIEKKKMEEYFCQIICLDVEESEKYYNEKIELKNKMKEPNENVIHLHEIYKEISDLQKDKMDVILVLTNIKINMNDFILENQSMKSIFKHYVRLMCYSTFRNLF
jgi:hypothetical protein